MALQTKHTGTKAELIEYLRQMLNGHLGAAKSMAKKEDKERQQGAAEGLAEAISTIELWEPVAVESADGQTVVQPWSGAFASEGGSGAHG